MTNDREAEVKDILRDVKQGWDGLRDKARARADQIYRHQAYRDLILGNMPPQVTNKVYIPSTLPDHDAWQIIFFRARLLSGTEVDNSNAAVERSTAPTSRPPAFSKVC